MCENPEISQDAIAEKINLSQPSIAARLKKLKEVGVIKNIFGTDPLKMGLFLAKVDITTSNTTKILKYS